MIAYVIVLALVALERLVEVQLSRRNAARAFARGGVEVGRAHFPLMVVMHAGFLVACGGEVVLLQRPFPGTLGFMALGGAIAAQALRWWAISTLGDRWNVRVIVLPDAEPVTGGPYRFVRHPNYVAVVLEMAALPLIHGAWWTAIVFSVANAFVLWVRIRAEEDALGPRWATAFSGRPRFIP